MAVGTTDRGMLGRIQLRSPAGVLGGPGRFSMTSFASWDLSTIASLSRTAVCMRLTLWSSLGGQEQNICTSVSLWQRYWHVKSPQQQVLLSLSKIHIESTTNLLYMNSTPTGKMDLLTLCVPFLMTLHSKTNAMPKCCCGSNFVLLFWYCFKYYLSILTMFFWMHI